MKKRLRIIATLALACVCFTLSGCGNRVRQESITEAETQPQTQSETESETQRQTEPPTETETEPPTESETQTELEPLTDENGETEPTSWDISGTIQEAVSYTHLDVYKRQLLHIPEAPQYESIRSLY